MTSVTFVDLLLEKVNVHIHELVNQGRTHGSIAQEMGLSQRTVTNIVNGRQALTLRTVQKILRHQAATYPSSHRAALSHPSPSPHGTGARAKVQPA